MKIPDSALLLERPGYTLKINQENGQAEFLVKAETLLDDKLVRRAKEDLEMLCPGKKFFLLVGSNGFFRVTRKARKLAASRKFSDHLRAVACYTSNSSLALLAELYIKLNKPAVPTHLFYSRELALEWLHEQMTLQEQSQGSGEPSLQQFPN